MLESISSMWQTATHFFLIAASLFFLLLFVCSCLCIAAWTVNWPVFVFSGLAWGGLLVSMAFAWTCITYYKPFFAWAYPEKSISQTGAVDAPQTQAKISDVELTPNNFQGKEAQLDALVNRLSKAEPSAP
jgi:hypothetical protein